MIRLSLNSLHAVPSNIARPGYDIAGTGVGIVHIGIGAFHRAHQATYTDAAMNIDGGNWGICGVSLKSPNVYDQLAPQNGLYGVKVVSAKPDSWRIVGSVREVLFAQNSIAEVIAKIARAETKIVSLTVTEKGYAANDPASTLGVLLAGLYERFRKRGEPITVLCCDNLPENGRLLQARIEQLAEKLYPSILPWLHQSVRFPSSMVDRIVPATDAQDYADAAAAFGMQDLGVVRAEPFTQWVIEDNFATSRPAWGKVGVQFVSDVRPFEKMKLRVLNGAHSVMAYMGVLAKRETIFDAINDPAISTAALAYMGEAQTTLDPVPGTDLAQYQSQLLERWHNPATKHRCAQIAMDGSQKIPQRLVAVAQDRLAKSLSIKATATGIAAWVCYLYHSKGESLADPIAPQIAALSFAHNGDLNSFARAVLAIDSVFGPVNKNRKFIDPVLQSIVAFA